MDRSRDFHASFPPRSRPASQAKWPRAAVFDFDGLLVDTARCWHEAFAGALGLSDRGPSRPPSEPPELNGLSVRSAANVLGVPASRLRFELDAAFERATLTVLPGAELLIERLQPRMPLAVATNGPADLVSRALERVRLRSVFDVIISAETELREKPAPDVYRTACARLGVDPSDAMAFEDSAVGAQAARSAGLTVVLVPSNPRERIDADLRVPRLDDNRLASLLRLDDLVPTRVRANNRWADGPDDARLG